MKSLLVFERKKFWRKSTIFTIIFFAIILSLSVLLLQYQNLKSVQEYKENLSMESFEIENRVKSLKNQIYMTEDAIKEEMANKNADEEFIEQLNEQKEELLKTLDIYEKLLEYDKELQRNYDKPERLSIEIKRRKFQLDNFELISKNSYILVDVSEKQLTQDLNRLKYLRDNNIVPLESPFEATGQNFLLLQIQYPFSLIWAILLILLFYDMYSLDFETGAYKSLYTKEYRRNKIFNSKCLFSILNALVISIILLGMSTIVATLVNGFGSTIYPVEYGETSMVPWSSAITQMTPAIILGIVFTISLTLLLSQIFKNGANIIIIMISLFIMDYSFREVFLEQSLFWRIWPFSFLNLKAVFSNKNVMYLGMILLLLNILINLIGKRFLENSDM
ncbi:ABC transporter permease subunit [Anaerosalibacter sp. Marseille-P3206]|uniref:ABC transporter permease subunit n=1 Tax=Anaerosalibacter sp. Marseille-P3206 TaxID=1871005 RepID=UPI0013565F3B|nr:ABC transporter permease subunit [Anaerosalibacter sp. Marseille-P3206]